MSDINSLLLFNEDEEPKKKKGALLKKIALAGGLAALGGGAAVGAHYGLKKYGQYRAEKEYNRPINKFKRGVAATGKGIGSGIKSVGKGIGSGIASVGRGIGSLFKGPKSTSTQDNTTHKHIYIHDETGSNKSTILKKPGFFKRHKGKLIAGAALAGSAYAIKRIHDRNPEEFNKFVKDVRYSANESAKFLHAKYVKHDPDAMQYGAQ